MIFVYQREYRDGDSQYIADLFEVPDNFSPDKDYREFWQNLTKHWKRKKNGAFYEKDLKFLERLYHAYLMTTFRCIPYCSNL